MMKPVALAVWLLPLLAFAAAGLAELRSAESAPRTLRNVIPPILGIAVFAFSFNPGGIVYVTPESSVSLSRWMTLLSAAIACSGVFITYSHRRSSVWIGCGGLMLAFIWSFNFITA